MKAHNKINGSKLGEYLYIDENLCTICPECKQECIIIEQNDSFAYSGTHCTHGQAGIHHMPSYYISECCEAEVEI